MGCSVGRGFRSAMALWDRSSGGESHEEADAQTRLERKLYLARESPDPEFDLSGCGLAHVPAGVFSLCRVLRKERLLINNNRLKSMGGGGALMDLQLITVLNLSHNKFSNLPSDLKFLLNLRELDLSNNMLTCLPDVVRTLSSLRSLDVSYNRLEELPAFLGDLKYLCTLKVLGNVALKKLCAELYRACNLSSIVLNPENFLYPPEEVAKQGTSKMMKFLSEQAGVPYAPPQEIYNVPVPIESPIDFEQKFKNVLQIEWKNREAAVIAEKAMHEAAVMRREKVMADILKEQSELDGQIFKIQNERKEDRIKLISEIQEKENDVTATIDRLLNDERGKPDILQQQLEYERSEHDRLLSMCRDNYHNIRTTDVLRAMESILEQQILAKIAIDTYESNLGDVKRKTLLQQLDISERLEEVLKVKDETRLSLIDQLSLDEDVQRAAVATLLESLDARSWSLKQEISLVATNLAKLTVIELEKKKLEVNYNYDQLLLKRSQLLELLDNLLEQQAQRQCQLIQTLKDMERTVNDTTGFWLANYQRLIDSAPNNFKNATRKLDPLLAEYLLQEGVIHCLPFLVNIIFSGSLNHITENELKSSGVNLTSDRQGILRAVKNYQINRCSVKIAIEELDTETAHTTNPEPSAPSLAQITTHHTTEKAGMVDDKDVSASECVICMDAQCEMVFIPCGHLCCCIKCGSSLQTCPICRALIENKIRVIVV